MPQFEVGVCLNMDRLDHDILKCKKCERLVNYRNNREVPLKFKNCKYWNKPVLGYGDINGNLLVIGLAPAFNGGNRTGRIFTGDKSSDFLISSLYGVGFTNIPTSENKNDGLKYNDMYITLAARCAPPDNVPLKSEIANCSNYLHTEIDSMKNLKAILCLGKLAFDSALSYFRAKKLKFINGKYYEINNIRLYSSYHPSPRNVNTKLLIKDDFINLLRSISNYIQS